MNSQPDGGSMARLHRPAVPHSTQARIYFRDGWLCHICRRPVVFHLSLKYLGALTTQAGIGRPLAYWNERWRRDRSPLLDELAASIDHVVALKAGGEHDEFNFATICARCNARKSVRSREDYLAKVPQWVVRGTHGEPTQWDGLSMAFLALVRDRLDQLTTDDRAWYDALLPYAAGGTP